MSVALKDSAIQLLQREPTFDVWLDKNGQCLTLNDSADHKYADYPVYLI